MASILFRTIRFQLPRIVASTPNIPTPRCVSLGATARGLEEFFPPGVFESDEPLPETVKTGRRWRANELRVKSATDLHKLWFVLLKERNMLLTVKWEARRQGVPMPSPERLDKVRKGMGMIKRVIHERELAIREIEKMEWKFDEEYQTELYKQNRLAELEQIDQLEKDDHVEAVYEHNFNKTDGREQVAEPAVQGVRVT